MATDFAFAIEPHARMPIKRKQHELRSVARCFTHADRMFVRDEHIRLAMHEQHTCVGLLDRRECARQIWFIAAATAGLIDRVLIVRIRHEVAQPQRQAFDIARHDIAHCAECRDGHDRIDTIIEPRKLNRGGAAIGNSVHA